MVARIAAGAVDSSERAGCILTIEAQDKITDERLMRVGSVAYGALVNVMLGHSATKKKGLHLCKPLNRWRARQDSNPRPLGS